MAVNEYVQAAAAHLENAAVALRHEAEQIRAEFMTYDRQATQEIHNKEGERRAFTTRAATTSEPSDAAHFAAEAARMQKEITDLKNQLEKKRSQMNQDVKKKESDISGLLNQAKGLYGKASSLK